MEAVVVREKPILFSGEMVRAILEGRKTVTRRPVTVNNSYRQASPNKFPFDLSRAWRDPGFPLPNGGHKEYLHVPFCHPEEGWEEVPGNDTVERWYCKWEVGMRLWVRETCLIEECVCQAAPAALRSNCEYCGGRGETVMYRADGDCCQQIPECACAEVGKPAWRPSIHMPRWASRLALEVTGVRVEQLQQLSWVDAIAEGKKDPRRAAIRLNQADARNPVRQFRESWDAIYAKEFPWASNPWVWVIEFKKL